MLDYLIHQLMELGLKWLGLTRRTLTLTSDLGTLSYLIREGEQAKKDEAIILLHGACGESRMWAKFFQVFKTNKTVIIPDLLGHGQSESKRTQSYTIATQVACLAQLLERCHIKTAHLVGNSMGGAIALQYAASYPKSVASLVLISTAGVTVKMTALQRAFLETGQNLLAEIDTVADYDKMLALNMFEPPFLPLFMRRFLTRIMSTRKALNRQIFHDILHDLDQEKNLAQITVPTLIIWGDHDQVLACENAPFLAAQIKQSQCVILPNVGHIPMVEKPKETAQAVTNFFSQL